MKKTIYIFLLLVFSEAYAQNVMSVENKSGDALSQIEVGLIIQNSVPFVAFQCDILLPSQVKYVDQSTSLTDRKSDHSISASLINGNTLRIVAFSITQKVFAGNSGVIAKFGLLLGSLPGNFTLELSNAVISNSSSVNILSSVVNGTVLIASPNISVSVTKLEYGRIPINSERSLFVSITNTGNKILNISRVYINNKYFELAGDTTFNILQNGVRNLEIKFKSRIKGSYQNKLIIESNDPDQPKILIDLNAVSYAVNELHQKNASGRSGHPIWINYKISNMEKFCGLQFDISLPAVLKLLPDSVKLNYRAQDHIIKASQLSGEKVRVIAYSPTNKTFLLNDGDVISIGFMLNGIGGNYNTALENVIISDSLGFNIISDYYSNSLNIISPSLVAEAAINFGECSINDSIRKNLNIQNSGSDTLIINSLNSENNVFKSLSSTPVKIAPSQNKNLSLEFKSLFKGSFTERAVIRSNDPIRDPFYLQLQAVSFNPNYIVVKDTTATIGDTCLVSIEIQNAEPFVAFQFDIECPANFQYINGSASLTNRKVDHSLSIGSIGTNKFRIFSFSLTQSHFLSNNGAVVKMKFRVTDPPGTYTLQLSNAIISNSLSQNILKSSQNGTIRLNSAQVKAAFNLAAGWNLVSVPVSASDMNTKILFPDYASNTFYYDNGYKIVNTLEFGKGYWVKYNLNKQVEITGAIPASNEIIVKQGWNLIGGVNNRILTSNIATVPINIKSSNFFGFNNGYFIPNELEPGKGYWIKVNSDGRLIFNTALGKNSKEITTNWKNDKSGCKISFTDNGNNTKILFLSENMFLGENNDLPPTPPSGVFDVRWSNNKLVESLNGVNEIVLSSPEYPVTIKVEGCDLWIKDKINGMVVNQLVKKGESLTITNKAIERLEVKATELPTEFELYQLNWRFLTQ
ncbi:MAG: hypothetical protein FD188_1173 [Ignavibacteria bacterium]|nr:MAG: hypothetical protein FD188_1173 [Ignavibacteria bacterium]